MRFNEKKAPVVIDSCCQDIYCSGIHRIEKLSGGNYRFVMFAEHVTEEGEERHIICQTIWHINDLREALRMVHQVTDETVTERPVLSLLK